MREDQRSVSSKLCRVSHFFIWVTIGIQFDFHPFFRVLDLWHLKVQRKQIERERSSTDRSSKEGRLRYEGDKFLHWENRKLNNWSTECLCFSGEQCHSKGGNKKASDTFSEQWDSFITFCPKFYSIYLLLQTSNSTSHLYVNSCSCWVENQSSNGSYVRPWALHRYFSYTILCSFELKYKSYSNFLL